MVKFENQRKVSFLNEMLPNMKGIVVVNPHNPTGDILPAQIIKDILAFADRHNLHVIMDEIYGLSVYAENAKLTSVLSIEEIPRPEMTHFIWSFSKDLGLAGFRCGILHTWNKEFIKSIRYIIRMCSVTALVQAKLNVLLSDSDWLDNVFFPESIKRLREAYTYCTNELQQMNCKRWMYQSMNHKPEFFSGLTCQNF